MFFVCYKAINTFCNDIKTNNIIIPKEFIDKQVLTILPNIIKEYTGNLKKRCKKIINLEMICLGRKLDGKQCTRKKHNDSEFCRSHFIKLSNGRIDLPNKVNLRNKRGRKRKVEFDPRQYDNDYITLWEDIINGEKVLVDINNNIYTFDLEAPQYIGKKDIFNKNSFLEKQDLKNPVRKLIVNNEVELDELNPLLETRELATAMSQTELSLRDELNPSLQLLEKTVPKERELEELNPSDKIELNIELNNKKVKDKKIKINKKTAKISL